MPESLLASQYAALEPPTVEEGHHLIVINLEKVDTPCKSAQGNLVSTEHCSAVTLMYQHPWVPIRSWDLMHGYGQQTP